MNFTKKHEVLCSRSRESSTGVICHNIEALTDHGMAVAISNEALCVTNEYRSMNRVSRQQHKTLVQCCDTIIHMKLSTCWGELVPKPVGSKRRVREKHRKHPKESHTAVREALTDSGGSKMNRV